MSASLEKLEKIINYKFNNKFLLTKALTHRSCEKGYDNEKLEFLGDAILNFFMAEFLYNKYPKLDEGKLTRLRSSLIRKETLVDIAKSLHLSDFLFLGPGELKSGGRNRSSLLEDTVEALIAAIYIDSDLKSCKQVVFGWFDKKLENLKWDNNILKDAKSLLQEYLQSRRLSVPKYKVIKIEDKDKKQVFTVEAEISDLQYKMEAQGYSIKKAEQQAARGLLDILSNRNKGSN